MSTSENTPYEIIYKEIAGFPDYRVGNDGSVWTKRRPSNGQTWMKLKPQTRGKGIRARHAVRLYRGRGFGYQVFSVHHLVLEAFVGPRPEGMEGCHFPDRNPFNNSVANLRWDTRKSNLADRIVHGTDPKGSRCGRAKLSESDVIEIRRRYAIGEANGVRLAREFGLSHTNLYAILNRRSWKHIP